MMEVPPRVRVFGNPNEADELFFFIDYFFGRWIC